MRDYYIIFGLTNHGTHFVTVSGDYETVNKGDRIAVYLVNAENEDEAWEVAQQNFPIEKWEAGEIKSPEDLIYSIDSDTIEYCGV